MRTSIIACVFATVALSGCGSVQGWVDRKTMEYEGKLAAADQHESAQPVGAVYEVTSTSGHKQLTICYSGRGLARVIEPRERMRRTIIDWNKGTVSNINFATGDLQVEFLDQFQYPPVLTATAARSADARCIGFGVIKTFPYHRWTKQIGSSEWEVWTDDSENFPVYFRAISGGNVTTWTLHNAWIDQTVTDRPAFFTLEPDPVPPAPPADETKEREEKPEHKTKHSRHKRNHRPAHTRTGPRQQSGQ